MAQCVHGEVGDGVSLGIIAEGDHKEVVADLLGQGGKGGAGSHKRDTGGLGQRAGSQGEGGVIETANRYDLVYVDQLRDRARVGGLIGFAIDRNDLDRLAVNTAGGVDLFGLELHTVEARRRQSRTYRRSRCTSHQS